MFAGLEEIVCLDSELCPSVIETLREEDWEHKVYEYLAHDFFNDLPYLIARTALHSDIQFLAVIPDPTPFDVDAFANPEFEFLGFELIDVDTRVDPILNCSSFEGLTPKNLTKFGLISNYQQAKNLQNEIMEKFPEHVHSETKIFAIWRRRNV